MISKRQRRIDDESGSHAARRNQQNTPRPSPVYANAAIGKRKSVAAEQQFRRSRTACGRKSTPIATIRHTLPTQKFRRAPRVYVVPTGLRLTYAYSRGLRVNGLAGQRRHFREYRLVLVANWRCPFACSGQRQRRSTEPFPESSQCLVIAGPFATLQHDPRTSLADHALFQELAEKT